MQRDERLRIMEKIFMTRMKTEIPEYIARKLLNFTAPEKRERILKQRTRQKADILLLGDILARVAVRETFGIPAAAQKFTYGSYGKPHLAGYPDVHFNISHSGRAVVCAVSDRPVGIDIQTIEARRPALLERVCTEGELRRILDSSDQASEFTRLWTQKEAVLKLHGTGIAHGDIRHCIQNETIASKKVGEYWISIAY